jgi:hypothetical protein
LLRYQVWNSALKGDAMKRACLFLLVLAACANAQAPASPVSNPSAPVDFRHGPVVWQEEFWDIKPDKLDEFMAAYRTEVYSIRRHIHGYRGYTVLTTLPKDVTAPQPPEPAGTYGNFISPHYGLFTGSGGLTERSINIGLLIRRTHNVIIIHHYQSWADADAFPAAFALAYAKAHNGESVAEGLARRLYPFVNNTWSTYYRLVKTGFPSHYTGIASSGDADGLNLEPHPEPSYWVKEFFMVDSANATRFDDAYERDSYAYSRQVRGHHGVSLLTSVQPNAGEAQQTASSKANFPLGGSAALFQPLPGMLLDGAIRTDESFNASAMFRDTFSIITYQTLETGSDKLTSSMDAIYAREHGGASRVEQVKKIMFPFARNHWDLVYRMIETSFTPGE